MLGLGTPTQVIKGPKEASQLLGIQYAQLPRSSPKGTASIAHHASRRQTVLTGGLHPSSPRAGDRPQKITD
jgi:hypothetical protein